MTVEPARGPVPLDVRIDSGASHDPDGQVVVRELAIDGGPYIEVGAAHSARFTTAGTHRVSLRVTDDSGGSATAEATVIADPGHAATSGFEIDLYYPTGRVGTRERQAFAAAAQRWSELVVGDLVAASVQPSHVEQACGREYSFSGMVDDLLLVGDVKEIDGAGGIVGMAGPCLLRSDGFPLVGLIILDRDDVDFLAASGDLHTVVRHELGHVLDMNLNGWNRRSLLSHDQPGCYDSRLVEFTGSQAAREFARLGGSGSVPVEENGVSGTACSHWDEETFRSELMTGYLDKDARLSRVSAGALADMGYEVELSAADDYLLPPPGTVRTQGAAIRMSEQVLPPGGVVDPAGDFTPLSPEDPQHLELELGPHEGHSH